MSSTVTQTPTPISDAIHPHLELMTEVNLTPSPPGPGLRERRGVTLMVPKGAVMFASMYVPRVNYRRKEVNLPRKPNQKKRNFQPLIKILTDSEDESI